MTRDGTTSLRPLPLVSATATATERVKAVAQWTELAAGAAD